MKTEAQRLAELENMVITLVWDYTLLAAYFEKESDFLEARQSHPEFSFTMHESLICSFVMVATIVFKEGDEAESLFNFIAYVGRTQQVSAISDKLMLKKRVLAESLEKLTKLRNAIFAHRSQQENPEIVFNDVKLKLGTLKELADFAKEILFELVEKPRMEFLQSQMFSVGTLQALGNDARLILRTFGENS